MDSLNYIINSSPQHCSQLGPLGLFEPNTGVFWDTVWTGDFYEGHGFFLHSEESGRILLPNSDEVVRSDFSSFAFGGSGNLFFASEYNGNIVVINNSSYKNFDLIEFLGQTPVLFSEKNVIYNKNDVLCYYHKNGDNQNIYYRNFQDNFQTEKTGFVENNTELIGIYYPTGSKLSYKLCYRNEKKNCNTEILKNYEFFNDRIYEDYSGVNSIPNNSFYGWNKTHECGSNYFFYSEDFSGLHTP